MKDLNHPAFMQRNEMPKSSTQIYISTLAIYRMSFVVYCILGM